MLSNKPEMLLREINEIIDHLPPAEWKALVEKALANENVKKVLWGNRDLPDHPKVEAFLELYLDWKKMLAMFSVSDGSAFQRDFWRRLLDQSSAVSFSPNFDLFATLSATDLMGEIISLFAQREYSDAENLNDRGFANHHPGGYEVALKLHERAIVLASDFALAWVNKGICLKNLGRLDEAIQCYDHIIERIDPEYKKAWHNKGVALMLKDEIENAVKCFDRALEIDPHNELARQVREKCLYKARSERMGQHQKHKIHNAQAIQMVEMGMRMENLGNWPAAARLYEQALSHEPGNLPLLVILGNALFESGRHQEAEAKIREVLAIDDQYGEAWLHLVPCYINRNDSRGALEAADRAVQYSPYNTVAWSNRAAAHFMSKQYDQALRSARHSVELDSHNGVGVYYLGVCLYSLGRPDEAREPLERFLILQPDSAGAKTARDILSEIGRK